MDNTNLPQIKHLSAFPAAVAAFAAGVRLTLSHPAWLWAGVKLSALVLLGGLIPALLLSALLVWGLLWADVPQALWGTWSGWWDVLLLGFLVFPLTLVVWRALVEEITESAQANLVHEVTQTLDPSSAPPATPGPGMLAAMTKSVGNIVRSVGIGLGLVLLGFVPLVGPVLAFVGAVWFSADALARVWLEALTEAQQNLPPDAARTLHAERRLFWNLLAFFTLVAAVVLNVFGGVALAVGVVAATAAYVDEKRTPPAPSR